MGAIPDLYKKLLGMRGKFKEKFKVCDQKYVKKWSDLKNGGGVKIA